MNKQIGERIKAKRKELNFTRENLSEKVGVSAQFLAEIEFGRRGMSIQTLQKICKTLGASVDFILSGKNVDEKQELLITIKNLHSNIANVGQVLADLISILEDEQ